jgi:four helix bundle protein
MVSDGVRKLQERMKQFGLGIIRLAEKMPASKAAGVVAYQILTSGTLAGANYRAACRARSKADFIAKMGIVEEELDETSFWLELLLALRSLPRMTLMICPERPANCLGS